MNRLAFFLIAAAGLLTICQLNAATFDFAGSDPASWSASSLAWNGYTDTQPVLHAAGGPNSANPFSNSVSGEWQNAGVTAVSLQALTSPQFTATATSIQLDITHRFNFESYTGNPVDGGYDGGRAEISINGGAWSILTMSGYSTIDDFYGNPLNGGPVGGPAGYNGTGNSAVGWSGTSASTTHTGTFGATIGDSIQIRFVGGWDESTALTAPNWAIESVSVSNVSVVPEPHEYAMVAGVGLLGFAVFRRVRAKAVAAA